MTKLPGKCSPWSLGIGYVWAPYIPELKYHPLPKFDPIPGIRTRYSKKLVRHDYLVSVQSLPESTGPIFYLPGTYDKVKGQPSDAAALDDKDFIPPGPILIDGLTVEQCLERFTKRQRHDLFDESTFLTPAQTEAARAAWEAQLKSR